jgi:hypothetical protein
LAVLVSFVSPWRPSRKHAGSSGQQQSFWVVLNVGSRAKRRFGLRRSINLALASAIASFGCRPLAGAASPAKSGCAVSAPAAAVECWQSYWRR